MISPECDRYDHIFCYGCVCSCHVPVQEPFKIVEKNGLAYVMPQAWVHPAFTVREIRDTDTLPYQKTLADDVEYYHPKDAPEGYLMKAGILGAQDGTKTPMKASKGDLSSAKWILKQMQDAGDKSFNLSDLRNLALSVDINYDEVLPIIDALLKHRDVELDGIGKYKAIK